MGQGYITIQEWMLDLGLSPSQLIAYAIIYGFSQDGKSRFFGNAEYIAKWIGRCERTAKSDLEELVKKGLIQKKETKVKGCIKNVEYRAIHECNSLPRTRANFSSHECNSCNPRVQNFHSYNNKDNTSNNKESKESVPTHVLVFGR